MMPPLFAAAFLISAATGIFLIRLLSTDTHEAKKTLPLHLFLGAGLGMGISSCVYFVCLLAGTTAWAVLIDSVLCLALGIACFFRRRNAQVFKVPAENITEKNNRTRMNAADTPQTGKTTLEKILLSAFFAELAVFCGAFLFAFLKEPHGRWDAWLIWNMHARFLARAGEAWQSVFTLPMDWSHWDYPLLLPLSIVRAWKYTGGESISIPAFFAFLFTLLTAGLLLFSVARLKNLAGGLAASMLLIATPFFILMGISQFADVPFSFFILATVVLLFLPGLETEKYSGPLIMAGVSAALAAWTKNEGILFFTVTAFVLFSAGALRQNKKEAAVRTGWFLAGALPVLLCVIYFKLKLAPPNDLTTGFAAGESTLSKLADPGRYAVIFKDFFMTAFNFTRGPVDLRTGGGLHPGLVNILLPIAWVWFMGISRDPKMHPGIWNTAAILLLMLAGYFTVYLLTPLPLEYHLATSLNRLYLQLWPSFIFLFFMAARAPAEDWSNDDGKKSRQPIKGRQIKR